MAVGRKNYLFAGSHEAARRAAVLYSLMRTCAQHGVPPLPYFTDVLRKLREHVPVTDLLPDRWCQQRCESGQNQRWRSGHSLRGGVSPSRVAWWAGQSGLPAMAEAIALAADRDGRGAVKQPVEERRGERRVGEDLVPLPKALVTRQDDRLLPLVAFVHEFKKTGRVVPLE